MAISFPRILPSWASQTECKLELVFVTTQRRTRGGGVYAVESADPYWDIEMTIRPMTRAEKAELQAWANSLRGGGKSFLAYDRFNSFPQAYASESAVLALTRATVGGAFDGTFEITSFQSSTTLLSINAATLRPPASFQLKAGDLISLSQSGRRSLHRVMEDVTATVAGNFSSGIPIIVEPAVKTSLFTGGTIADIIRPRGEFIIDMSRFDARQTTTPSGGKVAGFSKVMT